MGNDMNVTTGGSNQYIPDEKPVKKGLMAKSFKGKKVSKPESGKLKIEAEKVTNTKANLAQVSNQQQNRSESIKNRAVKDLREINGKMENLLNRTAIKESSHLRLDELDNQVNLLSNAVIQMKQMTTQFSETKFNREELTKAKGNLDKLEARLESFVAKRNEITSENVAFTNTSRSKEDEKLDAELKEFIQVLEEAAKEPGNEEIFNGLINDIHMAKNEIDRKYPDKSSDWASEVSKLMENATTWTEKALDSIQQRKS